MPRDPLYKTSTPLTRKIKQNTTPNAKATTRFSSLPPSSPYLQLTSDPANFAPTHDDGQEIHLPTPHSKQDPFGFLAAEKHLKDRRKGDKSPVLQSCTPLREEIRSIPRIGGGNLPSTDEADEESDGRPAFATPVRKAATESSNLSSPQLSVLLAPEGSLRELKDLGNGVLGGSTTQKEIVGRRQPKRVVKAKNNRRKPYSYSSELSEEMTGKENKFTPSNDYFDSLPRLPSRRTAAGITAGRSSRAGKGKIQTGPSKSKSARGMKNPKRERGRNKHNLADINKRIGNEEEDDKLPKHVGESFVFDGEEREVKVDRRSISFGHADLPARLLSDMKRSAKLAAYTSKRWIRTTSRRRMSMLSEDCEQIILFCTNSRSLLLKAHNHCCKYGKQSLSLPVCILAGVYVNRGLTERTLGN